MIISFQLAPPSEEQDQVESKVVEVEKSQHQQQKDAPQWIIPNVERGLTLGRSIILKKR